MKTLSKPFVALGIAWKKLDDFQRARLKLTAIYIGILFMILNIFTMSLFFMLQYEEKKHQLNIQKAFHQQEVRFENKNITIITFSTPLNTFLNEKEIIDLQKVFLEIIKKWIFTVEIILLFLSSFLSYFLSGKTLKPIQEKEQRQQQLLSEVSHELKNPLSALKTSLEISKNQTEWKQGEMREVFTDLESEISRLIHITNDLLQIENISASSKKTTALASDILHHVIEKFSGEVQKKNITLKKNIAQTNFLLSKKYGELVFFNLLHNAIKFSPSNSFIQISLNEKNIFRVQDFGTGISKKDLPHIFERFYKADKSRTFSLENGSGLGLSLVKKICDTQKWNLSVESEEEKGSVFVVKF